LALAAVGAMLAAGLVDLAFKPKHEDKLNSKA
jgi:hypothetical protein